MSATIRFAKPGEEAAIHAAQMKSIREVCVKDHGPEEIRGWGYRELGNRWIDAIRKNEVWVVDVDGTVQGLGHTRVFEEKGATKAYLHALYLTPEVLGKNFGTQIMRLMLEYARKSRAKQILLDSTITAHDFYREFGFTDSGPVRKIEIGGYPVTAYPMQLQLS